VRLSFHRCFGLFSLPFGGVSGSERVAVFSLSRRVRQGLSETFFSPLASFSFCSLFSRRKTRGSESPKRVAVSSPCCLCCQRLCETFFSRPPVLTFPALAPFSAATGRVRIGRRCMPPVGPPGQVLLYLWMHFKKTPRYQGVPIENHFTFVQ